MFVCLLCGLVFWGVVLLLVFLNVLLWWFDFWVFGVFCGCLVVCCCLYCYLWWLDGYWCWLFDSLIVFVFWVVLGGLRVVGLFWWYLYLGGWIDGCVLFLWWGGWWFLIDGVDYVWFGCGGWWRVFCLLLLWWLVGVVLLGDWLLVMCVCWDVGLFFLYLEVEFVDGFDGVEIFCVEFLLNLLYVGIESVVGDVVLIGVGELY